MQLVTDMSNAFVQSLVLRGLYTTAMFGAFLRYRNPRRQEIGRHQTEFYERAWRDAAKELGGTWERLAVGIGEIDVDGVKTRVADSVSQVDDPVTLAVLHNKPLTHQILAAERLPVPRHTTFFLNDIAPAADFLRSIGRDCVVKPAGGTGGGRGITTGVRTRWHLLRAAAAAAVYADRLLIEEQLAGENYRLLYLDGELIDAFVRRPPTVVGDGRSTVARLIDAANEDRRRSAGRVSQVALTVDLDMRRTLARDGHGLRSIPAAGRSVVVKTVVNENAGADNSTATHQLCDAVVDAGKMAVRALRIRFAGIDIITPDPAVPLECAGGAIIEVNGTPNLYFHYHKRDGAFPVAVHLLRRLLLEQPAAAGRARDTGCQCALPLDETAQGERYAGQTRPRAPGPVPDGDSA
jgi:cyanophycin synthetase